MRVSFKQLLLVLCFAINISKSYAQAYNIKQYKQEDGLPSTLINATYQDSRGYIWISTMGGGVSRLDGKNFVHYSTDDGLASNVVNCIYEDSLNNMWFGTDRGITVFDGVNFTILAEPKGVINSISQNYSKSIWVATENGAYEIKDDKVTLYNAKNGLGHNYVFSITDDSDGNVWFGTGKGLTKYNGQTFTTYTTDDGLNHNEVYAVYYSSKGVLWTGGQNGVNTFDGKSFSDFNTKYKLPLFVNNKTFIEEPDGSLWISSFKDGVIKFNGSHIESFTTKNGLSSNRVRTILKDNLGTMWFGTLSGLNQYFGKELSHINALTGLKDENIWSIYQSVDSSYWFGTRKGLGHFKNGEMTIYGPESGISDGHILGLYEDKNNTLWVGSESGMHKKTKNGFELHQLNDVVSDNFIYTINTIDTKTWAGTRRGVWVVENGKPKVFKDQNNKPIPGIIFQILKRGGIHYFFSFDNGYFTYNGTEVNHVTELNNYPLDSVTIAAVNIDKNQNFWIGTNGDGLVYFERDTFYVFTKNDGLLSDNIWTIAVDNKNNIWLGTERGVNKVSLLPDKTLSIKAYTKSEGFVHNQCNGNAQFIDFDGNIWIGTIGGATCINPYYEYPDSVKPKMHINNIKLFFEDVTDWGTTYTDFYSWTGLPKKLTLPYDKNHLSFNFTATNIRFPINALYQYKLEGLDENWSPERAKTEAVYSSLPPGNYTFTARVKNNNTWSKATNFSFKIKHPFWETWWFISLSVLLLITSIWWIVSTRYRRINQQIKLQSQLAEMEKKALRLQMNPHFIFNSLNAINSFIVTSDPKQATKYLNKFAILMRLTLEASKEQLISIDKEVELLDNYLLLEKLRFEEKFDYQITVSDKLNEGFITIPPMLIQPHVENAVLHGIGLKKGVGHIKIEFDIKDNRLEVVVTDNGVGRDYANKNNSSLQKGYKSMATDITQSRLDTINKTGLFNMSINITDLKDNKGNPSGTKVIFNFPLQTL